MIIDTLSTRDFAGKVVCEICKLFFEKCLLLFDSVYEEGCKTHLPSVPPYMLPQNAELTAVIYKIMLMSRDIIT